MTFTEFNESLDSKLNDLSELSEKYNIFNESVNEQLNINIEKAKVYVEESGGTDDDLVYLINEAKEEADGKLSAALNKLQQSTVDTFNAMADDLSQFADSAKLSVALDKLEKNAELMAKDVKVEVSNSLTELDKIRNDILAKLSVLKVNVNATISADELDKISHALKNAEKPGNLSIEVKASKAVSMYKKKLADIKAEVAADKNISKSMDGISRDKAKWGARSEENKKQIMFLVNKLTEVMSLKVSILKSDVTKLSNAIKAPKTEDKKEEPKEEKVVMSDILDDVISNLFTEKETTTEVDEADRILAEIETEIAESENNKIDEVQDIVFDESTNVDNIVDDLLSELL